MCVISFNSSAVFNNLIPPLKLKLAVHFFLDQSKNVHLTPWMYMLKKYGAHFCILDDFAVAVAMWEVLYSKNTAIFYHSA